MSFLVSEMSFTILEMSFPILAEMSFGQNAQKKSLRSQGTAFVGTKKSPPESECNPACSTPKFFLPLVGVCVFLGACLIIVACFMVVRWCHWCNRCRAGLLLVEPNHQLGVTVASDSFVEVEEDEKDFSVFTIYDPKFGSVESRGVTFDTVRTRDILDSVAV